jgi:hypothetical protein
MFKMTNYYFLIAAFPPLILGVKPELSYKELMDLLVLNLTAQDREKVEELLFPIDLYNMRAFWLGEPFDERGHLKEKELEEELLIQEGLPLFVVEFLEKYESTEDRVRYFASLYASLYREQQAKFAGFLRKYAQFERDLRLVLVGLRAHKTGKDLLRELQFEDPTDPWVAEILAQKDMPDFTPPREFEDLKSIFIENYDQPQALNRAILEYRFNKIEEMEEIQDFSIDRVLAYVAKFILADSLANLDKEKGMEQLSQYE